jgi:hypothetical protein
MNLTTLKIFFLSPYNKKTQWEQICNIDIGGFELA